MMNSDFIQLFFGSYSKFNNVCIPMACMDNKLQDTAVMHMISDENNKALIKVVYLVNSST